MPPADATIRILERIQESIATMQQDFSGMRQEMNARFDGVDARFEAVDARLLNLEGHVVAHTEILGIMNERLGFFERAATAANEGRARLETRVDGLESRVYQVETDVGELQAKETDDD